MPKGRIGTYSSSTLLARLNSEDDNGALCTIGYREYHFLMSVFVKNNGVWKASPGGWLKDDGVWKPLWETGGSVALPPFSIDPWKITYDANGMGMNAYMTVSSAGDVYLCTPIASNANKAALIKISQEPKVVSVTPLLSQHNMAYGLVTDKANNCFVMPEVDGATPIYKMTPDGVMTLFTTVPSPFKNGRYLEMLSNGDMLAASDYSCYRIKPDGTVSLFCNYGTGALLRNHGICVTSTDDVCITVYPGGNYAAPDFVRYGPDGVEKGRFAYGGSAAAADWAPDIHGNVYIVRGSYPNHTLCRVKPDNSVEVVATISSFDFLEYRPSHDDIILSNIGDAMRRVSATGVITTFADAPAKNDWLRPKADRMGNIYSVYNYAGTLYKVGAAGNFV